MKRLTILQCVAIIVISLFVTSALGFSLFRWHRFITVRNITNQKYILDTIVQTGPEKGALLSAFLSQILGLSVDHPQSFYLFDENEATKRLQKLPIIKEAYVRKEKPNRVYVDYAVRQPIALIADFTNTAIDLEKKLFPLYPFYSSKRLTEFYLGISVLPEELTGREIDLALSIWRIFSGAIEKEDLEILRVDVSNAFCDSYGKREVVVVLSEKKQNLYLRLTPRNYAKEIGCYLSLRQQLQSQETTAISKVIDLRIPKLAYIEEYPDGKSE